MLESILHNIVGFDLNPLAVMSARTNYLLALGDLLQHRRGEVTIPVYLADSILTPSQGADLFGQHGYAFNTAVGKFTVPRSLVDARYIDQLADLLEECVTGRLTPDQFRARLLRTFPLDAEGDAEEVQVAVALYEQMLDLERQEIDGIWARIIKNAFAPLFQGRFDYVAGNPPWVNWAALPADYRQQSEGLWSVYGLFPHTGLRARLGSGSDDISVLMTYVAIDQYLATGGKLGFVITQAIFKSKGGGQGFRQFRLTPEHPIRVLHVDDMVDLQPFEGASNRTSLVIIEKGSPTRYPVPYTLWRKAAKGTSISQTATLHEVIEQTVRRNHHGQPIDANEQSSPWVTGRPNALRGIQKMLGQSTYSARKGVTPNANAVYWIEIVSTRPDGLLVAANYTEGAKNRADQIQAAIEPDWVFPLLRGRDVGRWSASPSLYMVAPQQVVDPAKPIAENDLAVGYPKTFDYLKRFEDILRARKSGIDQEMMAKGPFYSIYGIGRYSFAPFKVVWREIATDFTASVIGEVDDKWLGKRPVLPDHKLILVACDTHAAAHYLCCALNSSPVRFVVRSYSIMTQVGTHIPDHIALPVHDPADSTHVSLSNLSQQAHAATAAGEVDRVREIEADIDRQAAKLWGLTDAELKEIQESLAELG